MISTGAARAYGRNPRRITVKANSLPNGGVGYRLRQIASEEGEADELLKLNVGGGSYRIWVSTLKRRGLSRLSQFGRLSHEERLHECDAFLDDTNEYYFERCAYYFAPIYHYYATGNLHNPYDVCPELFRDELNYWKLHLDEIEQCCQPRIDAEEAPPEDLFIGLSLGELRRKVWNVVEQSHRSGATKLFELVSVSFILLSITGLVLSSVPELQIERSISVTSENGTDVVEEMTEHPVMLYIEHACVMWFSVELILRVFAAPRRLHFLLRPLTIVDAIAITPFYAELVLVVLKGEEASTLQSVRWAFLVVRLLRVMRVIRVIKLGRFSSGLRAFAITLQRSQKQLNMMGIVLMTGMVFFSTIVYYVERHEPDTKFRSIPATFWWCVVTMTTVGYGDMAPETTAGKLAGSGAIIMGVFVLALPITIIVDNFIKVSIEQSGPIERDE